MYTVGTLFEKRCTPWILSFNKILFASVSIKFLSIAMEESNLCACVVCVRVCCMCESDRESLLLVVFVRA